MITLHSSATTYVKIMLTNLQVHVEVDLSNIYRYINFSDYGSVGRASDYRFKGPGFNPGLVLHYFSSPLYMIMKELTYQLKM